MFRQNMRDTWGTHEGYLITCTVMLSRNMTRTWGPETRQNMSRRNMSHVWTQNMTHVTIQNMSLVSIQNMTHVSTQNMSHVWTLNMTHVTIQNMSQVLIQIVSHVSFTQHGTCFVYRAWSCYKMTRKHVVSSNRHDAAVTIWMAYWWCSGISYKAILPWQ